MQFNKEGTEVEASISVLQYYVNVAIPDGGRSYR